MTPIRTGPGRDWAMHGIGRWTIRGLIAASLLGLLGAAWLLWPAGPAPGPALLDIAGLLSELDGAGASSSTAPARDYRFPADHGPHPEQQSEVWDLRALLTTDDGRRLGLRATFLRLRLIATERIRPSRLAARELIAARIGLVAADTAQAAEQTRAGRTALNLAGSAANPTAVWVEDWRLEQDAAGTWRLDARLNAGPLQLRLTTPADATPIPVGDDLAPAANSRPIDAAGYRQPGLAADGIIATAAGSRQVTGHAWLDHGWGAISTALAGRRGQLQANRFLLRLDDGTEVVCRELRRIGGGGTPIPSCTLTTADGQSRTFGRREVKLTPAAARWRAPDGTSYPLLWTLRIPATALHLDIEPLIPDQRLRLLDAPIWSGALTLAGTHARAKVSGGGWMDLGNE